MAKPQVTIDLEYYNTLLKVAEAVADRKVLCCINEFYYIPCKHKLIKIEEDTKKLYYKKLLEKEIEYEEKLKKYTKDMGYFWVSDCNKKLHLIEKLKIEKQKHGILSLIVGLSIGFMIGLIIHSSK